ncbi:ABC transporter substrate-binding protein [Citricoccus sp. NR2]|uniref:ABC transporter substrate-binding protein n=1 Tax=Citricoccus sp. NR2 TaxID=3004095 RepID=UPI0022DD7F32|nr:ABC transporter substrate-binding protein [Citricoccus sp. NR2]WBL19528.1 ABC transporter substrate-binding protein [Citricoccus sp. NR2]
MNTPIPPRSLRRSRVAPLALLTGAALVLAGCSGSAGAGSANTDAAEAGEPVHGGTLRVAVGSDAGCIDPQQVGNNDSIYSSRQLVDSLTDQDPETGEIVPWLAEGWEINEDATEFTFTLQEGATFSNGDPVDAEAVAANLDRGVELGARASLITSYLEGYSGTEIIDERTFTVTFDEPSAQFLQATSTHTLGILHPDSAAASDDERCTGVIGSGPFVLENYSPNEGSTFTAREDYDWGSSVWENTGAPYVDGIEFSIVPESGVRAGSLQSGQVDLIGNIAPQDAAQLTGVGAQLLDRTNPGIAMGLRLNHDHEFLSDPLVREAITRGIDREEIVDVTQVEGTPTATSVLSSTTPGYTDVSEALEGDDETVESLLAEAGFEQDSEGYWKRDGKRLSFEILWFNVAASNSATVELIQQQLAGHGIEVTLQEGQVADWQNKLNEGDYDANLSNITRADPDILRSEYHTDLKNQSRLEASELDELLDAQASEGDEEARNEIVADAQRTIVENYRLVPVYDLTTVLAAGENVHGVHFDSGSRIHLSNTWIED